MSFGENLKSLREMHGLTQDEFSRLIGISRSAIGMYEKDQREPDLRTLHRFCGFFRTDMNHLLGVKKPYEDLSVGIKIKQLRESSGKTQADLAKILGVSDQAISAWENGHKQPRTKYLIAMARHYGIKPSWFIDEDSHEDSRRSALQIVDGLQKLEQEDETIKKYQKLPEKYKAVVRQLIDALS